MTTLPGRLLDLASSSPQRIAFRRKRLGLWEETTYAEYAARVAAVGLGLVELGVEVGDRVAVQSRSRPEWVIADVAVQGIGAVTVGVYPSGSEADVLHVLQDAEAMVVIVEDEEQLDKVLAVRHELPALRHVIVIEPPHGSIGDVLVLADIEARGGARPAAEFAERVAALDPASCAIVVYTSGTTGLPRGAMLSHENLRASSTAGAEVNGGDGEDEVLSYLPLAHIAERLLSVGDALFVGYTVNFGGGHESLLADLREVQPTVFLGVPRVWERLLADVEVRIAAATRLKRTAYRFWVQQGRHRAERRMAGRLSLVDRLVLRIGWLLLYRPLRKKLGMSRIRIAVSAAAPVSPDVLWWLWSIGVPVREAYGQTENSALATWTRPGAVRIGSVGPAAPGVELRIADDGEILVRSAGTFLGYVGDETGTKEVLDTDGWLHTGDVGTLDADGFLTITDRKKDLIITAGGENVAPSEIENRLKVSPFVKEALVIGERRPYLTALVGIEWETVADWAARHDISFATYEELAAREEIHELVQDVVDQVNASLGPVESIRAFRLLPDPLEEQEGELTATQKVKRATVAAEYADLIDSMYARRTA